MKYIKKFESFGTKPVSKELSDVYKSAIENRFATLDGSSTDTEEVTIAPPVKPKEPITRPWRPVPTQKPDPSTKERPMGMMKTYEEFRMGGEVETAPVTAPPTTTPGTTPRPWRPIPTQKPSPGTQEKPMGTFDEVMNMFFSELNKVKDTSEGQEMLKNIESKYGNL
jgi:hypothetical protein